MNSKLFQFTLSVGFMLPFALTAIAAEPDRSQSINEMKRLTAFSHNHRILDIDLEKGATEHLGIKESLYFSQLHLIDLDAALQVSKAKPKEQAAPWETIDEDGVRLILHHCRMRDRKSASKIKCKGEGILIVGVPDSSTDNHVWSISTIEKFQVTNKNEIVLRCFVVPVWRKTDSAKSDEVFIGFVPRKYLPDGELTVNWEFLPLKDHRYHREELRQAYREKRLDPPKQPSANVSITLE